MTPHYSIEVEPRRRLVRIKIDGFFQMRDAATFIAARYAAHAELPHRSPPNHLTLCDVSDCRIQLNGVVEALRPLLSDPDLMSRRLAFVTGASSVRMQIRRLINRETAQAFETIEDAEAWLFDAPAAPRGIPELSGARRV